MSRRDPYIDALKCLAILLVALGHAITTTVGVDHPGAGLVSVGPGLWVPQPVTTDPLLTILYSFHMPLFAFVSGFVLFKPVADKLSTFLRKRTTGLLVPYFAWFTVTFALAVIAGRAQLQEYFSELLSVAVNPANPRALWYLYALFFASLLLALVARLGRGSATVLAVSGAIAAGALGFPGVRGLAVLGLGNVIFIYPYLVAGYLCAPAGPRVADRRAMVASTGAAAFIGMSLLAVFAEQTRFVVASTAGAPMRALLVWACTAWAAVGLYAAYHWLSGAALRWQAVVGRRTLGIYAMHSMAQVALVQLLGLKVVPVVFGVSVVASFLATLVIERIPVARTVLLDVRRGPRDTQDTPQPALSSVP